MSILESPQPTILVADDTEGYRCLLSDLLEDQGYKVVSAEDGEGAVKVLRSQGIDLALLDVMMPLIILATLQLAMKGNATALKEVWERSDGKVLQMEKLQFDGKNGRDIKIKVVYEDGPAKNRESPQ